MTHGAGWGTVPKVEDHGRFRDITSGATSVPFDSLKEARDWVKFQELRSFVLYRHRVTDSERASGWRWMWRVECYLRTKRICRCCGGTVSITPLGAN